jgi:hypothetical protein
MRRTALAAACVAGLAALTACAADPGRTPGEVGTVTTSGVTMTPSTTPEPGAPPGATNPPPELTQPVTTFPPGSEVTVTGTVMASDVETGCLLLEGYELVGGDPSVVRPGQRVRVTGRVATDMASTCQQGPILVVSSAQRI